VYGIREFQQSYIVQWVDKYSAQIPQLLKGDFPYKDKINVFYDKEIKTHMSRINDLEARIIPLEETQARADQEIQTLMKIRPSDFEQKLRKPEFVNDQLELYLNGCFAEWETIPIWFKQIIEQGAEDA